MRVLVTTVCVWALSACGGGIEDIECNIDTDCDDGYVCSAAGRCELDIFGERDADDASGEDVADAAEDPAADIGDDAVADVGDDTVADVGDDTAADVGDDTVADVGADTGDDAAMDAAVDVDALSDVGADTVGDATDVSPDTPEDGGTDVATDVPDDSDAGPGVAGDLLFVFDSRVDELADAFDPEITEESGTWLVGRESVSGMYEHDHALVIRTQGTANVRYRLPTAEPVILPEGVEMVMQVRDRSMNPVSACRYGMRWNLPGDAGYLELLYYRDDRTNALLMARDDGELPMMYTGPELQTNGNDVRIRLQSVGTSYRVKVWIADELEPTEWYATGDHGRPSVGAGLSGEFWGGYLDSTPCDMDGGVIAVRALDAFSDEPVDPWYPPEATAVDDALFRFDPSTMDIDDVFSTEMPFQREGWTFSRQAVSGMHEHTQALVAQTTGTGNVQFEYRPLTDVVLPEAVDLVMQVRDRSNNPPSDCVYEAGWLHDSDGGLLRFGHNRDNRTRTTRVIASVRSTHTAHDPSELYDDNGVDVRTRLQSDGTSYRMKTWRADEPEPSTWSVTGDHGITSEGARFMLYLRATYLDSTQCSFDAGAVVIRAIDGFTDEPSDAWFPRAE